MHGTVKALIARGVDLEMAERLAEQGLNLSRLKQMSVDELSLLGIAPETATDILKGRRPPIPSETVARLLYRNRFQCCVCRDPAKSIILHHINPWAVSRNHAEANLAVLCLQHHAQAHSTSTLAQNLDQTNLKAFKEQWEAECERLDAQAILRASRLNHSAWLYFNHQRLFALANELEILLIFVDGYDRAHAARLVDDNGMPCTGHNPEPYLYHGGNGLLLYAYVRNVLHALMQRLTIINMSDRLDPGLSVPLLAPGDFLFIQGAHTFRKQNENDSGPGQISSGVRQAHGVTIKFVFDRWEATSTSAWGLWLLGRQSVGSLVHIKSLERDDGQIVIKGTVLGISNGHSGLKARDYAPEVARLAAEHRPIDFDNLPAGWYVELND